MIAEQEYFNQYVEESDVVYDYLIMDEASQVGIATGSLAFPCTRKVVIVGDTKQLSNVVTDDTKPEAKAIFDIFNVNEGYQYTKSLLQSILDVCIKSKIYSMFDYLYKQYTEKRMAYLLMVEIIIDNKYSRLDIVCHFPLNMLIKNPELLNEQECWYAITHRHIWIF